MCTACALLMLCTYRLQALAARPVPPHSRAHVKLLAAGARGAVGAGHTAVMDWFLGQLPDDLRQPPAAPPQQQQQQQQENQVPPAAPEEDGEEEDAPAGQQAPQAAADGNGAGAGAGAALMGQVAGMVMMAADMAQAMGLAQMAEAFQGAVAAMDGAGAAAAAAAAGGADAVAAGVAAAAGGGGGAVAVQSLRVDDNAPWDAWPRLDATALLRLPQLLEAAAEGAPCADTLEQLHMRYLDKPGRALDTEQCKRLVVAAARCKAADWRARLELLEARRYPRPPRACAAAVGAAAGEEGLARLRWLLGRGFSLEQDVVSRCVP